MANRKRHNNGILIDGTIKHVDNGYSNEVFTTDGGRAFLPKESSIDLGTREYIVAENTAGWSDFWPYLTLENDVTGEIFPIDNKGSNVVLLSCPASEISDWTVNHRMGATHFGGIGGSAIGTGDIRYIKSDSPYVSDSITEESLSTVYDGQTMPHYRVENPTGSTEYKVIQKGLTEEDVRSTSRTYTKQQNALASEITDASTLSWDLDSQQSAYLVATDVIGANRLLPNSVLAAGVEQGEYKIHFNSGSGGHAMQFDTNFEVIGEFDTNPNRLTIVTLTIDNGLGKVVLTPFVEGSGVESVTGNVVDNTDPQNPVVNVNLSGIEDNKTLITRLYRNTWHSGVNCGVVLGVADDYSDLETKTSAIDANEDLWLVGTVSGGYDFAFKKTHEIDFFNAYFTFAETVYLGDGPELGPTYFQASARSTPWAETTEYYIHSGVGIPYVETGWPDTEGANLFGLVQFSRISDASGSGTPADYDKVVKVTSQSFTNAEKTQGRTNLLAEKKSQIQVVSGDPTSQNFIDWEGDILLVQTARNFVLPASGTLSDGARYLVKTDKTGTVAFSTADGSVTIEYNDVNALGNMAERSEAWVLLKNDVYYITGEVA